MAALTHLAHDQLYSRAVLISPETESHGTRNRLTHDSNNASPAASLLSSQYANSSTRTIVRRRQPEPISAVRTMSLAGLKNLFFGSTSSPDWNKTNRARTKRSNSFPGPYDWSNETTTQPLLKDDASSLASTAANSDHGVDLEAQDSTSEKSLEKKGFRIDAKVIGDATLGLSDGLTVPFALTAGLSALGNTKVVIYGGLAELIAGAISMGLGGYLSAKGEADAYQAMREETEEEIALDLQSVMEDVKEVFVQYNLPQHAVQDITQNLSGSPQLIDFVMKHVHCEQEPASSRAATSAITIAVAYFLGGLLPLLPYFCVGYDQVYRGLYISIGVMVIALFVFGYVKSGVTWKGGWSEGRNIRAGCWGGVQMVIVGSAAAGAAMGLVKLFNAE